MKQPKSQQLYQLAVDHFNEPLICNGVLCRLVGYAEDEQDCYFIVESRRALAMPKWYQTCVGGYTFLDALRGQNQVVAHNGDVWDDLTCLEPYLPPPYETFELNLDA